MTNKSPDINLVKQQISQEFDSHMEKASSKISILKRYYETDEGQEELKKARHNRAKAIAKNKSGYQTANG